MILKCDNNFTRILDYVIQASDQACLTGLSNFVWYWPLQGFSLIVCGSCVLGAEQTSEEGNSSPPPWLCQLQTLKLLVIFFFISNFQILMSFSFLSDSLGWPEIFFSFMQRTISVFCFLYYIGFPKREDDLLRAGSWYSWNLSLTFLKSSQDLEVLAQYFSFHVTVI